MESDELRIFFVGDDLTAGTGDGRAMGWTSRVLARTQATVPLTGFTLAVPGENTSDLAERWESEVTLRMGGEGVTNRLVVCLGSRDVDARISSPRSRLNLGKILDQANRLQLDPFVVGPPPRPDLPNKEVASLSAAFADVSSRRSVPFVDTVTPLSQHDQWHTDTLGGSYTPQQAGYGLMAWLVLHNGWHQWLGIKES